LRGHTEPVVALTFSPDGSRLVTAGRDQTLQLWDGATGREILTLLGPGESVDRLAFSDDGTRLFAVAGDGTVKVWDATPLLPPR
jgi:WD40 repeat protein